MNQPSVTAIEALSTIQNQLRNLEIDAHQVGLPYEFVVMALKRQCVIAALERNRGNQCAAAKDLHVHRNTLQRHMDTLHIDHRTGRKKSPQRA
jgi:Fis family transcriptional regulator, factor for inversion stimulation protein